MDHPFTLRGPIIDRESFFGRNDELEKIFSHISKGQYVSLLGESLSGKTSLLYHLQRPEVQARYWRGEQEPLFVFIDCQEGYLDTRDNFYSMVLDEIRERVPEMSVIPIETRLDLTFKRYLKHLKTLKKKFILILDEFEVLHGRSFPPTLYDDLRARQHDGACIITATRVPLSACCPDQVGSDLDNICQKVYLGSFTQDEFDQFIDTVSSRCQFPYDDFKLNDYKAEIFDLGGRFPFFIQQAAYRFWEVGQEGRHRHLTREQLGNEIRRKLVYELQGEFNFILDHLRPDELEVLRALAKGVRAVQLDSNVLSSLKYKGYVLDDGRIFSFAFREGFILTQVDEVKRPVPKLDIDEANKIVRVNSEIVVFTELEDKLFWHLYRNRGRVCPFNELWEKVWGYPPGEDRAAINTAIRRLRVKIKDYNKDYIQTAPGRGYIFVSQPSDDRSRGKIPRSSGYKSVR